jgi:phosphonopyruvate decarboxylase
VINPKFFVEQMPASICSGFFGVPDSLLASVNVELNQSKNVPQITACNEGSAVAMAIGAYLATGLPALVYLQNSGLGNTINPLVSLAGPEVYGIPMVLLIGWRGKPGTKDEPQHLKQGLITDLLLETMGVPNYVLPQDDSGAKTLIAAAFNESLRRQGPVAILVEKGSFANQNQEKSNQSPAEDSRLTREEALSIVCSHVATEDIIVSTTGMLSRELEELQGANQETPNPASFYSIGGMGHASSIALGLSITDPASRVWCMDGDGAILMHMGALPVIGSVGPKNYIHIAFDNGTHDSVGGQPTLLDKSDICLIAKSSGYLHSASATSEDEIREEIGKMTTKTGPSFLRIHIRPGARDDLGRPKKTPEEMKFLFMRNRDLNGAN